MAGPMPHLELKLLAYLLLTCPLQYLCCELAALQQCGQLVQLQVFDVAHKAWRLKVACELDSLIHTLQRVGAG